MGRLLLLSPPTILHSQNKRKGAFFARDPKSSTRVEERQRHRVGICSFFASQLSAVGANGVRELTK